MSLEQIPIELRQLNQWVCWKTLLRNGKLTKPPVNPNNPIEMADHSDPTTWASFDLAVATWRENPSVIDGIGFVFSDKDDFFGIDIDDERKVAPEFLDQRRQLVGQLLASLNTYTEVSPSGTGLHMIGRGRLPVDGKRSTPLQFEIYHNKRFFTITGRVFDNRTEIRDEQAFINSLPFDQTNDPQGRVFDTDVHRRTDLTDEEVIRLSTNFSSNFAPRFNAQMDNQPGQWSETFMALVGVLDRFSGSVEQVERIICGSPFVLASPNNGGESRLDKAKRNFQYTLAKVRQGNNGTLQAVEHGKEIVARLERTKRQRAEEAVKQMLLAEDAINSGRILEAFPMLDKQHRELTPPPGLAGEFVTATANATNYPFLKFAIPATIGCLAGIIGRGYKLPNGSGINVNFILAAESGAGKTQTTDAWMRFLNAASQSIDNTPSGQSFNRILKDSTSSIQGIFDDFMHMPSCCWVIEECSQQLRAMASGSTTTEQQLRDKYNELYDASQHNKFFMPPRSIAGKKANHEPVNNLAVSTFWTTTPNKFDVYDGDALDGFLSRVTIIRQTGAAGEITRYTQTDLTDALHSVLVSLLGNAKRLDETYQFSAHEALKLITTVSLDQVTELIWQIRLIVDKVKNKAFTNDLPKAYVALSRLPVTAERIAAVLAVIENPFTPSVTEEQYLWAFGYAMQNALSILGDMDAGELGARATDETLTVARTIKEILKKQGGAGVSRTEIRRLIIMRAPFSTASAAGKSASKMISDTFDLMLREGMLIELLPDANKPGRPKSTLAPTDDPIWRSL